jgi:molybdenum ABC transporter molybdate-binding protein
MAAADAWDTSWSVGLRVWIERAGQAVVGPGRFELVEAIDRCRSISAAARQLGMSYRHAWVLVQSINEAAGTALVEAAPGGHHGGGARVTDRGRAVLGVFRELQAQLRQTAATLLPRLVQGREPPTVHVAAAVSLEEVVGQLLADYALHQPAVRVRAIFGASDELADHVLTGAPIDLFLTADPRQLDRLKSGLLTPGAPPTVLAGNTLAVIGPAEGGGRVRRPADLARAEAGRVALADPTCPLGQYTHAWLTEQGLGEAVRRRALLLESSRAVLNAVRGGQAEVGVVYASDAARAIGCRVLCRVRRPPLPIRYAAAVLRGGRQPEQAADLLRFFTSPRAARRFRGCGFLPVRGG